MLGLSSEGTILSEWQIKTVVLDIVIQVQGYMLCFSSVLALFSAPFSAPFSALSQLSLSSLSALSIQAVGA